MIHYQRLSVKDMALYREKLSKASVRGCEYSFVNLYLWGNQKIAQVENSLVFFSLFDRHAVYPFPTDPSKAVLDAILEDAHSRGIPCCLTTMSREDCDLLEALYPGQFHFHLDRDGFDYVYAIDDLADLKGRKYQKKRNHVNRFHQLYPGCAALPMTDPALRQQASQMLRQWFAGRNDDQDYHLEQRAMAAAFDHWDALGLEGLALVDGGTVLAFAIASRLNDTTYDIHFEKAREDAEGAYAAINWEFARYLRSAHPQVQYLNREDDLGLEGLRKAKLSYLPHHLVEKFWAAPMEDDHAD